MSQLLLSDPMVARFRTELARLIGSPERIGIAVSGGPDSLALLLLAHAAHPGKVEAATVDHGLRAASADEAALVARLCAGLSIPHAILHVTVPNGRDGLQGEARRARYAALAAWASERRIGVICTGHHADDQAETLLMRLQRGSGVGGLAGVRPVRREGKNLIVARPLLGWTRAELGQVVRDTGVRPVEDSSNHDTRFDRVRTRQFLAANPQFKADRLARSAASLAEADSALEWAADLLEAERCASIDGEWRIDVTGLPRELARRLLARTIGTVRNAHGLDPPWTGAEDVETLLRALEAGQTATLAGTKARPAGPLWHVSAAPPRRNPGSAG